MMVMRRTTVTKKMTTTGMTTFTIMTMMSDVDDVMMAMIQMITRTKTTT